MCAADAGTATLPAGSGASHVAEGAAGLVGLPGGAPAGALQQGLADLREGWRYMCAPGNRCARTLPSRRRGIVPLRHACRQTLVLALCFGLVRGTMAYRGSEHIELLGHIGSIALRGCAASAPSGSRCAGLSMHPEVMATSVARGNLATSQVAGRMLL